MGKNKGGSGGGIQVTGGNPNAQPEVNQLFIFKSQFSHQFCSNCTIEARQG